MDYTELAAGFVEKLGGTGNIIDAKNCMTRLRITVKDPSAVDDEDVGTVYLYKIDTLYNIFLTVHGTSTENSPRPFDEIMAFLKAEE